MKIKPEHLQQMKDAINASIAQTPTARQGYTERGLSWKQFAWDVLNFSRFNGQTGTSWICSTLYPYMNDSHIETALRQIIPE